MCFATLLCLESSCFQLSSSKQPQSQCRDSGEFLLVIAMCKISVLLTIHVMNIKLCRLQWFCNFIFTEGICKPLACNPSHYASGWKTIGIVLNVHSLLVHYTKPDSYTKGRVCMLHELWLLIVLKTLLCASVSVNCNYKQTHKTEKKNFFQSNFLSCLVTI